MSRMDRPRRRRPANAVLPVDDSIFRLIDEYEEDSEAVAPIFMQVPRVPDMTSLPVVDVENSSDGDDNHGVRAAKKGKTMAEPSDIPVNHARLKCLVCFGITSHGGDHHASALKCGHVFGEICLKAWVKPGCPHTCPICKEISHEHEVIKIFPESARDDILEEHKQRADDAQHMEEQLSRENANLVELNKLLYECVKRYAEACTTGKRGRASV